MFPPTHCRNEVVSLGAALGVRDGTGGIVGELKVEQLLRQSLVVHAERVVLAAARKVIIVGRKSGKIFLVYVAGERAQTVRRRVYVPQLKLAVRSGGDNFRGVEKFNVRNGLLVATEDTQRFFDVTQVVVVDAMIGRTERQVARTLRIKLDTANVRPGLDGRDRMVHVE